MAEDFANKLSNLLRRLFQFDAADLDFGIYRIMNQKRVEIEKFIDVDLVKAVDEEFGKYEAASVETINVELEEIRREIREKLGPDATDENGNVRNKYPDIPVIADLVKRYEAKRAEAKNARLSTQHKSQVFSHIYQFFSRYYDQGDFMPLRRYSQKKKYVIPYNGEEVVFYWANYDQYYIKTGEHFYNYTFKEGTYTVYFSTVNAESSVNNNKDEKRYFLLSCSEDRVQYNQDTKTLKVLFEYRGLTDEEREQFKSRNANDAIIKENGAKILESIEDAGLLFTLGRTTDTGASILDKHLYKYSVRNNTDYFIHKDLEGFLKQELDSFIKNEVFKVDEIGTGDDVPAEQYVIRSKVIKGISLRIIEFLAQIENFEKKLFEKKKFVISTDYGITLDYVPEEFYEEILQNDKQLSEWTKLYGAGVEEQATLKITEKGITHSYLHAHPNLVLDTKFFNASFKDKLLASLKRPDGTPIQDLDDEIDGLLVHSENWQALNLLRKKYYEQVQCIYVDPPFNTDASPILYKNGYKNSTWISMMNDRLEYSKSFLKQNGVIVGAIDDEEQKELGFLLSQVYNGNNLGIICVRTNPSGRPTQTGYSVSHEYLIFAGKSDQSYIGRMPPTPEQMARFSESDDKGPFEWRNLRREGSDSDRSARPYLYYPIFIKNGKIRIPIMCWDEHHKKWILQEQPDKDEQVVYPNNEQRVEKRWRWSHEKVKQSMGELAVRRDRSGKDYVYYKRRPHEAGVVCVSSWFDPKYSSTEHGTALIKDLFGSNVFSYPKSLYAVMDAIYVGGSASWDSITLDPFAGSGTTAHAVLSLNNEDKGARKYILIEMGDYFHTVMKPRIEKVVYAADWKDGKPKVGSTGQSQIFKYQTLEQYEDTLNNIEFTKSGTVQRTLQELDSYMLRYMLDYETRDSQCRLNVDKIKNPFNYGLKVAQNGELITVNVDLVETFNYLLGLHIKRLKSFDHAGTYYKVVYGVHEGKNTAIVWRKAEGLDLTCDKSFIEKKVLDGFKADKIYVNADSYVEGAIAIEPEFKRLMGA